MRFAKVVLIKAPADTVWNVMLDLEAWPEMTKSITSLERLDAGPLAMGSRVRIKQPRLAPMEWTVTELVDGQRFVWESDAPGVHTSAAHTLLEVPGETTLRLEIEQTGPLSVPVALAFRPIANKYLDWESQGFKQRAERLV